MNRKILHKRSNVATKGKPKLPTADQLDYGELAINYADGNETIAIKNSNNDIVSFKSQEYIDDKDLFIRGRGVNSIITKNNGGNTATGNSSFAEGCSVIASGLGSHAEGGETKAQGAWSHAEGFGTTASGNDSHAEGWNTVASEAFAHAEGQSTTASNYCSHAEGNTTTAIGVGSHSEGQATIATIDASHAEGRYNVPSTLSIHCVGIGTGDERKVNAEDILISNGYKYLIGLGNYDGTNLTVTNDGTESVNPDIKSIQEIVLDLINRVSSLENK